MINNTTTNIERTKPFFVLPISHEKVINTTRDKAVMTTISTRIPLGGMYQTIEPSPNQPIRVIMRDIIGRLRVFMDIVIILTVLIFGFGIIIVLLLQNKPKEDLTLVRWLDNSSRMMTDLQKSLGEMNEVGRGIKSLQDYLASPKLRGGLGEEILSQMLAQVFPKQYYQLQHSFKSGVRVDAVIKTDAGLLCIDSKFPLGDFDLSAIKKHFSDISQKYILPAEKTLDFALMYIPSEAMYYEVASNRELTKLARELRVYAVSPNTLYAHLQVILLSFQGKQMEEKAKQVLTLLLAIQKDHDHLVGGLGVLGRHLTNAFNQMSEVNSSAGLLGQKLNQTKQLKEKDE
ncbi:MAG: DNA recombination protein RmuC [Patescibacteria group bacterium]